MKNKGIKSMAEAVICQFTEISLVTPVAPFLPKFSNLQSSFHNIFLPLAL